MDNSTLERGSAAGGFTNSSILKEVAHSHDHSLSRRSSVSSISGGPVLPLSAHKQVFAYHNLGFHGREEESRLIIEALDRARCHPNSSELILVRGNSGLGKSTLIEKLKPILNTAGAYVVSGKFDQMRKNEPFSAIVAAFTDLVDIVGHKDAASLADDYDYDNDIGHHHAFSDQWDSEDARLLRQLISNLYYSNGSSTSDSDGVNGGTKGASMERLTACCCKFLRAVASNIHPVVFHLDDIQWADRSSLALAKALLSDKGSKNLVCVCTFRDLEVFQDHVHHFLKLPFPVRVTQIQLRNLDLTSTNKIVADLLANDDQDMTRPLAEVILQKTHGNPFFVISYVESLEAGGLMKKLSMSRWGWDLKRIQSETNVASNVADLVTEKIKRLPADLQLLLKLAACFGFEFDRILLEDFVIKDKESSEFASIVSKCRKSAGQKRKQQDDECCKAVIGKLLAKATDEGLVEKKSETKYKFAHDRIQQCLYDMIPDGEKKESMHMRLGELVWELARSRSQPQDWMVFAAANHMNHVPVLALRGKMDRQRVAELNLEAAKLSTQKAALLPATEFLHTAAGLLEDDKKWGKYYDLMLHIMSLLAEIEFAKGNIATSKEVVQEIMAHARSLEDKLPAHYTMIDCLGTEGKLREAMELGFSTLGKLGCRFPKKAGLRHVVWELLKAKRLLRDMTDEKLLNLPVVTDARKLARMRLASLISVYAPFLGEEKQILVLYLRVIQMCVRDGNSYLSPTAFAMYGMVEAVSGNTKSAARIGQLCLKMIKKFGSRQCGVVPVSVSRCGMLHWIEPVRDSLEPLDRNVEMGISWGESKGAFYALQVYFSAAMYVGESLDKLEDRMRNVCEQKEQFDFVQKSAVLVLMLIRPMWQAVLNLQGNATDASILSGEALLEEEFMTHAEEAGNFGALVNWRLNQLQLAYMFGNFDLALKTAKELEKQERFFSFHFDFYFYLLFSGLTYVAKAEETGERQYKVKANKIMKKLDKINNVNSRPLLQLLRAQYRALNAANMELVQIYFDDSVSSARKAHLPNLEALANELAWMASTKKHFSQPKSYLARAIQLYSQWGANAKVESLEKMAVSLPATVENSSVRNTRLRAATTKIFFEVRPGGGIAGPAWAG